MRPGPRPKPTRLKLIAGNPGKRRLNKNEPQPQTGAPEMPEFLIPEARALWERLVPELETLGLLTKIDGEALAGYCQSWARYVECERFIDENGSTMVMRNDKGEIRWVQTVPQVGMAKAHLEAVRKFASEFGLSPASRTRLSVTPQPADSKLNHWLELKKG